MIKGLYIHIPFCDSICPYCDFKKRLKDDLIEKKYKDALIKEIVNKKEYLKDIDTIYIGGGTPTAFNYLLDILETIDSLIDLSKIKELTIETTTSRCLDYLNIYNKYKVNRISIGVESFDDKLKQYLNRTNETKEELIHKINKIRKSGINNINLDFIYSMPYSSTHTIKNDLELIKEINPNHISFYDLIIEPNTTLSYDLKRGRVTLPNETESVKMRDLINKTLKDYGYKKYEISNWAKDGYESIHNKYYWNLEEYISFGVSAHSFYNGKRYENISSIKEYIRLIEENDFDSIIKEEDTDLKSEYFLMGLRLISGVSLNKYKELFNTDPFADFNIQKLIDNKLLVKRGDNIKLSKRGLEIGNIVFMEFL